MKIVNSLSVFILCFFMISCGSDGGLTLTLNSPSGGDIYTGGQTIEISGTAMDDVAVSIINIEVPELTITESLTGNSTPTVPFTFSISLAEDTPAVDDVTVRVIALDDEGNRVEEERKVSIE